MTLRRVAAAGAAVAAGLWGLGPAAGTAVAAGTPVALSLPQSTAFAILGASCGGIYEQVFATGFDPASGQPVGAAYLQTRCGGSGRGGGGGSTTYSAWVRVSWDFTGTPTAAAAVSTAPAVDPTFSLASSGGDVVANTLTAVNVTPGNCTVGNTTYCSYRAWLTVPLPAAPSGVSVTQVADSLSVSWAQTAADVTATMVTATPSSGGTPLTASVPGGATTATIPGVAPSTTYSVVVASTDVAGSGPRSAPVSIVTAAATTRPGTPGGVKVSWGAGGRTLDARWSSALPGNSPVDDYQVSVARHDPNGPAQIVDAATATSVAVSGFANTYDWSVQVRAHNAAGWGSWSKAVVLPAY